MCVGQTKNELQFPERTTKRNVLEPKTSSKSVNNLISGDTTQFREDILAISTYYTKIVFAAFDELAIRFQKSNFYKILCHTTQPAHVVAALAISFIAFSMYPSRTHEIKISPLWTLVYLAAFSIHFGAQIWMTFVSGLALYFNIPRHIFGNIQKVLFPKYFLLNAVLSFITLSIFLRSNKTQLQSTQVAIQVAGMTICFIVELLIRLYATPPLLKLIDVKNAIEKEAGVGMEIGKLNPGNLLKCPHYMKIHKAFRKLHMAIAIGNITAMSCTILHLHYLSYKLCSL